MHGVKSDSETPLVPDDSLVSGFDEVAAHQATCGCHPVMHECCFRWVDVRTGLYDGPTRIPASAGDVADSAGQPWHLDPLCKVRPEAKA